MKWAEAVWETWLPTTMLQSIACGAIAAIGDGAVQWRRVTGPGRAMVATARRLGWTVVSGTLLRDDLGRDINLVQDSPAMVRHLVRQAVRRWRMGLIEGVHPSLMQGGGRHGPFMQPVHQLLKPRDSIEWGPDQRGALRSAATGRQWSQHRLWKAGLVDSPVCRLCIDAGFEDEHSDDPRFRGTLIHRILTCPALEEYRQAWAPRWILDMARQVMRHPSSSI